MTYKPRPVYSVEMQMSRRGGGYTPPPAGDWNGGHDMPPSAMPAMMPPELTGPLKADVDFTEVMEAISGLNEKFDRYIQSSGADVETMQVEIADISGRIRMTKAEIAALRHPLSEEDKFMEASEQLTEVVKSTEQATEAIMNFAEQLDDIIADVRANLPEGYAQSRVNDMSEIIVKIFEACNFQDLTGQRITKVVRTLSFIEERIDSMMSAWNAKEFETMPLPPSITKQDGELELHGPDDHTLQTNFTQDDIDALFD